MATRRPTCSPPHSTSAPYGTRQAAYSSGGANMATNDTEAVRNKVAVQRAKAKDGRLVLAPGIYFIDSGSVYLAPGHVLIACEPPGLCSIQVPEIGRASCRERV